MSDRSTKGIGGIKKPPDKYPIAEWSIGNLFVYRPKRQTELMPYNNELVDRIRERLAMEENIEVSEKKMFSGYVEPIDFQKPDDLEYWIKICLDYNPTAKASKKK
jgi:hypothetical protein